MITANRCNSVFIPFEKIAHGAVKKTKKDGSVRLRYQEPEEGKEENLLPGS